MKPRNINAARLARPAATVANNDVSITILYFMGQVVADPSVSAIEYKPVYFKCHTVANCQRYKTDNSRYPDNEFAQASIRYVFVIYNSSDISGINRNLENGGDYIQIDNESSVWYKVDRVIQSNSNCCVVHCIQTAQDPEKPNSNAGVGINTAKLAWG